MSRFALVAVIGGFAAGCSGDTTRFAESPFANPFNQRSAAAEPSQTGSIPAHPTAPVRSEPLPPPVSSPQTFAASQPVTPAPVTGGAAGWSAAGGTRVTLGEGDTLQAVSTRYGIPPAAILSANNLTAAELAPGRQIVIPVYNAAGTAEASAAPRQTSPARVADRPVAPAARETRTAEAPKPRVRPGQVVAQPTPAAVQARQQAVAEPARQAAERGARTASQPEAGKPKVRPGQVVAQRPGQSSVQQPPSKPAPQQSASARPAPAGKPPRPETPLRQATASQTPRTVPERAAAAPASTAPAARPAPAVAAKPAPQPARAASPAVEAPSRNVAAAAPAAQAPSRNATAPARQASEPARVAAAPAVQAQPAPEPPKTPARDVDTTASTPGASFRWPARGRVINGFGAGDNQGINIAVPEGTPVRAADGGTVTYAGSEVRGYGNLVLIKHDNGYVSAYAHNGELNVRRGERVTRGQQIAKSGQTGNVTSPQLHFEIRRAQTPVDPTPLLSN